MNAQDANTFVYALHYKMESMEKWATTVQEAITDHAEHIDSTRARAAHSFGKVESEITRIRTALATGESDTRTVMDLVQKNDDALKGSIAGLMQLLGSSIATTKSELEQKVQELQTAVQKLHETVSATATAETTGQPGAPPGLPFHHEIEALKRRLQDHENLGAHLLDPLVLTQRLTAVEATAAQALAATQSATGSSGPGAGTPAHPPHAAQGSFGPSVPDPWHTYSTEAAPQNLGQRFAGAAEAPRQPAEAANNPFNTRRPFGHDGSEQRAEQHEIHSLGGMRGQLRLDLKLARIEKHFYRDNSPETWHKNVRTFLLGCHQDMVLILDWIEARGKEVITADSLKQMKSDTMIDLDPLQVARELWSWLNLTLEHSSSAQRTFHLVEELNGAEVYRQLVAPLGITKASVKRRSTLRDKVQNPVKAKNWGSILDALADWNHNKLAFSKAGGTTHSDEDEREINCTRSCLQESLTTCCRTLTTSPRLRSLSSG